MPTNTAIGSDVGDATGLAASIAAEDEAEIQAAKAAAAPTKDPKDAPAPQGEGNGEPAAPTEEAPAEGAPAAEAGKEGTPTGEEPPAEGNALPDKAPIKIGDREYATADDAIAEAQRVIGHNANLAGENESVKTKLQEAVEANLKWQQWYKENHGGEAPAEGAPAAEAKPLDEDVLAEKVAARVEARRDRQEAMARVETEVAEIATLPHYATVFETIRTLADKTNPLTGLPFTPKTAYEFAMKHHGLEAAPASPPPKPESSAAARAAAARPAAGAMAGKKPAVDPSDTEADAELRRAFPLFR